MNPPSQHVILSTAGFALRNELAAHAEEKAAKLLRHLHPHIGLIRVHVVREAPHSRAPYFAVRARAETAGPDFVTHAQASEPATALNLAFQKLERLATATARARKHDQHHCVPLDTE